MRSVSATGPFPAIHTIANAHAEALVEEGRTLSHRTGDLLGEIDALLGDPVALAGDAAPPPDARAA